MLSKQPSIENKLNIIKEEEQREAEREITSVRMAEAIGKRLAYYLGEINAIHPFREGNGRAQRLFVEHLAHSLGYQLDFMKINRDDMLLSSVKAFDCDYIMLEELLTDAL